MTEELPTIVAAAAGVAQEQRVEPIEDCRGPAEGIPADLSGSPAVPEPAGAGSEDDFFFGCGDTGENAGSSPETDDSGDDGVGPDPEDQLQEFVDQWLRDLATGWSHVKVGNHADALAARLAIDDTAGVDAQDRIFTIANDRLKERGYAKRSPSAWRKLVERARKAKQSSIQQAQTRQDELRPRYVAISQQPDPAPDGVNRCGILDTHAEDHHVVVNAEPVLIEHVTWRDDDQSRHTFRGQLLRPDGKQVPWQIDSADYVKNERFMKALYDAAGPALKCGDWPAQVRNAIADISGPPRWLQRTTRFGWNDSCDAYLVPGGRITAAGFQPHDLGSDEEQVDLTENAKAAFLGMRPLEPSESPRVQQHLVEDLLALHHTAVTHTLLGTVAAAVLQPLAQVNQRFALWLVGNSGSGKTTLATLFANFFGDFPPEVTADASRFMTWGATINAIEHTGYYYRNALYLVDDFKSGLFQNRQVVALVQRYADGTGRDRLHADATLNSAKPIRGLMVVTAENHLDNQASSTARTILVEVEQFPAGNRERLERCKATRSLYSGVMADFISWLLRRKKLPAFRRRVARFQQGMYALVQGQPNADRVTSNLAVLAASYSLFMRFLAAACPAVRAVAKEYLRRDLVALLRSTAREVKEQRPIEVFWETLCELAQCGRVCIQNVNERAYGHAPVIGRGANEDAIVCHIYPGAALEETQRTLQAQQRQPLALESKQIARLLRQEGKLVDEDGEPLPVQGEGSATQPQRLRGRKPERAFCVLIADLMYSGPSGSRPQDEASGPTKPAVSRGTRACDPYLLKISGERSQAQAATSGA